MYRQQQEAEHDALPKWFDFNSGTWVKPAIKISVPQRTNHVEWLWPLFILFILQAVECEFFLIVVLIEQNSFLET